jgi:hypothetical protein
MEQQHRLGAAAAALVDPGWMSTDLNVVAHDIPLSLI